MESFLDYPIQYETKIPSNGISWETNPLWNAIIKSTYSGIKIVSKDLVTGILHIEIGNENANSELKHLLFKAFGLKAVYLKELEKQ